MTTPNSIKSPRERIIETACDLFYKQGYHSTGINQIISESSVAKASFYDHFPSKDALLYEYVCEMSRLDFAEFCAEVNQIETAKERFYGPFHILLPWLNTTDFRGCPFQNVVSEIPPKDEKIQKIIRKHRAREHDFFRDLAQDYRAEDPKLTSMDCEAIADMYQLLFNGAIATATAYRENWPVEHAISTLEDFISKYSE